MTSYIYCLLIYFPENQTSKLCFVLYNCNSEGENLNPSIEDCGKLCYLMILFEFHMLNNVKWDAKMPWMVNIMVLEGNSWGQSERTIPESAQEPKASHWGKLKEFRICTFLWNFYISTVEISQEWRNEILEREWPFGVPRFRLDEELVVVLNHCESDSGYSPAVMSFMIPWSYHV